MKHKAVHQYLTRYAEPEAALASSQVKGHYEFCLVVPAYNESLAFLTHLTKTAQTHSILLILVVNQPEDEPDEQPQQRLWQAVLNAGVTHQSYGNLCLVDLPQSNSAILGINRFDSGLQLPPKQGVGLARKIGLDCAVSALINGAVQYRGIYSTDADVQLPRDYFAKDQLGADSSGGVFDFVHADSGDPAIDQATQLYEQRLHHYVGGLKFAGSPYAFHTIGSCLLVDALAYCQARGFPRRAAGEDFYLLNKLAKLGTIKTLTPQLTIRARISTRVPFGTGPAVAEIIDKQLNEDSYKVYHPECFVRLKQLLQLFQSITADDLDMLPHGEHIDTVSCKFLENSGFFNACMEWQRQHYSQSQLHKVLSDWFDAFRTLKYIHHQRDHCYPDIPLSRALALRPW